MARMAISAVLLFIAVVRAAAHGGKLHEYPSTPSGSNYIRTKIASCSKWVPPTSGVVKYSLVSAAAASKPIVQGDVTVWNYLYDNCSVAAGAAPSAGVEFNVTITQDGKPLSNATLDGVAMTGTCASGAGTPYYFDPKAEPLDGAENLLWFHNFTTKANGRVHGNGANDGDVVTAGPASIKSVMLVNMLTKEPLACCDLTIAGPVNTDWSAKLQGKGVVCDEDPHAGHNMANNGSTTDMPVDHSGHDKHDQSDHAGHDHGNMTANARNATSSAAGAAPAAAVSAALSLIAVLAMLL